MREDKLFHHVQIDDISGKQPYKKSKTYQYGYEAQQVFTYKGIPACALKIVVHAKALFLESAYSFSIWFFGAYGFSVFLG